VHMNMNTKTNIISIIQNYIKNNDMIATKIESKQLFS